MKNLLIASAAVCVASASFAAVKPASVFNHNMVLQREKPVPVWGVADPGEKITVSFGKTTRTCVAAANGTWRVDLAPMPACETPRDLRIGSVAFTNVVVGEVWLCSGQSNMTLKLWREPGISKHSGRETDGYYDSILVDDTGIRAASVKQVWSIEEQTFLKEERLDWTMFTSGSQRALSAIAFNYAVTLRNALKIPIGVVVSAWGGAAIEPFISPDGFRSVKGLEHFADKKLVNSFDGKILTDEEDAKNPSAAGKKPAKKRGGAPKQCRIIWNSMIRPLVPMAIRGAIWYQGETNRSQELLYADYLEALWNSWSKAFENPELSFYLVQLAPYRYGNKPSEYCGIWTAQENFARRHPHAGMVASIDCGELDNIHPCRKRTVSMRLAAMALNRDYGRKDIPCDGPALVSATAKDGAVTLKFDHVKCWCRCGDPRPDEFEVAGEDGVFKPATPKFGPGKIIVSSAEVVAPKAVRYLWSWLAFGAIKSEVGLPLTPFNVPVETAR